MNMKQLILAGCSVIVLGAGTAGAGPCDMGRTTKDAGSGPAAQSSSQTTSISTDAKQHPPTETMNRASGDVAASSQDTQRQMQGQPTAAQGAQGRKADRRQGLLKQRNDESAVVIASRHARAIPR